MDTSAHNLETLFQQLGLPAGEGAVEKFVAAHGPLSATVPLDQAAFWTKAQADFLRQAVNEDADWAEVVDTLDTLLRH